MNYRLSAKAEADLIQIYLSGVEDFGVAQAEDYQNRLDQAIELIGHSPEIARLRSEITPPVRIHPVKSHIIVYLIDDNRMVRVLRVRHGRENWPEDPID